MKTALITSNHNNNVFELFWLPLNYKMFDSVILVNLPRKSWKKYYFKIKRLFFSSAQSNEISLEKLKVPFLVVDKVNSNKVIDFLQNRGVKRIISCNNHSIFKKQLLNNFECINIHRGLLPEYSGTNHPWLKPLADGKKFTGITVHRMNEKIDDGKILFRYKIKVLKGENLTYRINCYVYLALCRLLAEMK